MSRSVDTLYRQWLMLSKIPRYPNRTTAIELKNNLSAEGYEIDVRTVQRDLDKLSTSFPLNYDTEGRKNFWYWIETAAVQDLPGMEPVTALAFQMAESYLSPIVPKATLDLLQPYFHRAKEVLQTATQSNLKTWPDKVAVISRGPDLLKPKINAEIQQVIYDGLLKEKQIKATYQAKSTHKNADYIIHPLAIVNKHGVIYLLCTLWNYSDIKQLALHRFKSAELIEESSNTPEQFTLSEYVQADHQFSYPITPELIQLKVLFDAKAGEHLSETPLTGNQALTIQDGGQLLLEAEISDTQELRWWLSGFGSAVEVVEPIALRLYFQSEAELLNNIYNSNNVSKQQLSDS